MHVVARVVGDVARDGDARVAAQGGVFFGDVGGIGNGADQRHVVAAGTTDADVVAVQAGVGVGMAGVDGLSVGVVVCCARREVAVVRVEAGAAVEAVAVGDEGACAAVDGVGDGVAVKQAALAAQRADGVMQCRFGQERGLPAAAVDDGGVAVQFAQVGEGRLATFDVGVVGKGGEQRGQVDDAAARVVEGVGIAAQFGVA